MGDMFGVLSFEGPSSIGYVFNPLVTRALVHSAPNATWSPEVGQTVVFRNITFPYDLSCQAFYYLGKLQRLLYLSGGGCGHSHGGGWGGGHSDSTANNKISLRQNCISIWRQSHYLLGLKSGTVMGLNPEFH